VRYLSTIKSLVLHVRYKYFNQIKSGEKTEEYREMKPYWIRRLHSAVSNIRVYDGYSSRFLTFPWNGYEIKTITHDEFGQDPVKVYAIRLSSGNDSAKEKTG